MSELPTGKNRAHSGRDVVVCAVAMALAWAIIQWWMPSPDAASSAPAGRVLSGVLALTAIFAALALYGVVRFAPDRSRWVVVAIVVVPAMYAGALLGGLRSAPQGPASLRGEVRVEDALAALWWGKQSALDLPLWSRGGVEPWPTIAGTIPVYTRRDRIFVDLTPQRASPRQCQRILSELSGRDSMIKRMEGSVILNGQAVPDNANHEGVCQKGGMMGLVAKLPQ